MKNNIWRTISSVTFVLLLLAGIFGTVCATPVSQDSFALDMEVKKNSDDASIIDVNIKVKDIQQELDAVEFTLGFNNKLVSGCITENGSAMDAFMTVKPMYTFVVSGVEVPVSRYEQICTYNAEKGVYVCRFLDILQYANKKPGEVYEGLIHDDDLVITIQFKILDGVSMDREFVFSATNVKGTTRGTLLSVKGSSVTASIGTPSQHIHNWNAATCTNPKTCNTCGLTEGTANGHIDANEDLLCDQCGSDITRVGESADENPDSSDISITPFVIVLTSALFGLVVLQSIRKRL